MSKKNRRKTLPKKEPFISKNEFDADDSKIYILATIIMFHIVPLILVMFGSMGKMIYEQAFLSLSTEILFISITGVIYGIKKGFNFKFPIIMAGLAVLSLIFYGEFRGMARITGRIVYGLTYLIWAYVTVFLGGFLKRVFRI